MLTKKLFAQRPKPKEEDGILVLDLAGMTLIVDVDSFTIPEAAKMNACINRIVQDATVGVGVAPQVLADITVACSAYVVALRTDPALAFDDWFGRFSMRDLQKAIRIAKPGELDRPEA